MTVDAETAPGRWRRAAAVYADRRVVAMLFLGFSAGLPAQLIFGTLSFRLAEAGLTASAIGFVVYVKLFYSVKLLWAPLADSMRIPVLDRRLGRRRSWMLVSQLGVAGGILGLALSDPAASLAPVVAFAALTGFCSATQDIAIDAFRIEKAPDEMQGAMAASYVCGYRIGWLLLGSAGALYIAELASWETAYLTMAALMGVGVATTLVVSEPPAIVKSLSPATSDEYRALHATLARRLPDAPARVLAWVAALLYRPLRDFVVRYGAGVFAVVLALVLFYRLSDEVLGVMAHVFYQQIGFTKIEVANVTKLFGFWMTIAGTLAGGVLVRRFGIHAVLVGGAVLVGVTNLLFALLANVGPDVRLLVVVISADNIAQGIATTAFVAFLSSLTSTAFTASQYAVLSSLMTLLGTLASGPSGLVADGLGWEGFFFFSAALAIPGLAFALIVVRLHGRFGVQVREADR